MDVSGLERDAHFVVSQVKVLCIPLLKSLHELRQRLGGNLDEQMNVIGHQTVGINLDAEFCLITRESI